MISDTEAIDFIMKHYMCLGGVTIEGDILPDVVRVDCNFHKLTVECPRKIFQRLINYDSPPR